MPNPERLLGTLQQAVRAFHGTPGRVGKLVELPPGAEVMVVGDLHGNVENFRRALHAADLANHPHRHLVVQEVVHGPFRYPQGGDKSHQTLDLVAALKCQYPSRVHYLLGNHELAQWQRQPIGKGDVDQNELFERGVREAYGDAAERVVAAYDALFAAANFAVRTANRVFLSHTAPREKYLEAFDPAVLRRDTIDPADVNLGGSLHSIVWGRPTRAETVAEFLRRVDADWLISGHIPCPQGFVVPNDQQIILDALGTPACYCRFAADRPLTLEELRAGIGVLGAGAAPAPG